jgi:hypothetical protein
VNDPANVKNSGGLLKKAYVGNKGPTAQMNEQMPMMKVLRMKRDAIKVK